MFIKRIKYILIALGIFFALILLVITLIRQPSYTIKTSGKLYIVNKVSRDIQVFNLFTGKEIANIPIDMQSHQVISTKDENKVVVTNYGDTTRDGIIKVISTKTNKVEKVIDFKRRLISNGIVALPEPNKIAVIDYVSNNLVLINIETDSILKKIDTKQNRSYLMVLHPQKPIGYVTNKKSNSVSVIDLISNKVVKIIPCGLRTESIDITPDGSEIWVTNKNENSVTIINTSNNSVIDTVSTGEEPLKVKFSIDGKYCLVANGLGGTIDVYNQQSKEKVNTIRLHGKTTIMEKILYHTPRPVNILMHPNGLYAFISNSNASKIEVVNMKTFKVVSTIGTGRVPDALAFVE